MSTSSSTIFEGGVAFELLDELEMNDTGNIASNSDNLVSDTTAYYFKVIVYIAMSACVSVFGILANILNIIVFVRQGIFTDSGSPSLLGLAVSDLCCVVSMLWLSISVYIVLEDPPGLSFEPWDIHYLTGAWPHIMFAQITRTVTAYVAFERCICVVFPFKVKSIFTPKRCVMIISGIFVCFGLSYSPLFIEQQLKFQTDPITNKSRLVMVSSPTWQVTVDIMLYVNSITFNVGSVVVVIICTMITVSRVKLSRAWRESLATESSSSKPEVSQTSCKNDSSMSKSSKNVVIKQEVKSQSGHGVDSNNMSKSKMKKEKKLVRMIISISVIFLISYSPDMVYLLMFAIDPDIRIMGKYENLAMVMYSFTFLMETINSSINIIIYYKMSSRYKIELDRLLGRN